MKGSGSEMRYPVDFGRFHVDSSTMGLGRNVLMVQMRDMSWYMLLVEGGREGAKVNEGGRVESISIEEELQLT